MVEEVEVVVVVGVAEADGFGVELGVVAGVLVMDLEGDGLLSFIDGEGLTDGSGLAEEVDSWLVCCEGMSELF